MNLPDKIEPQVEEPRENIKNDIINCLGIVKQTKYQFEYYSPSSPDAIAEMIISSIHYWHYRQLELAKIEAKIEALDNILGLAADYSNGGHELSYKPAIKSYISELTKQKELLKCQTK